MKLSRLLLATFVCSTLCSTAALADTFKFSFGTTSSAFHGYGSLTGKLISPGDYLITAVSGVTDTGNGVNRTISGIEAPGSFPTTANGGSNSPNDNLLFFNSTGESGFFDSDGLSFMLGNGAQVNLYDNQYEFLDRSNGATVSEVGQITVLPTPEPSSLLLLGTGAFGAIGMMRRRLRA